MLQISAREVVIVLIVEDSVEIAEALCEKLERHLSPSPVIRRSLSIADALGQLTFSHFDLVICDFELPDGYGTEVFAFLESAGRDTDFVMFTGSHHESDDYIVIRKPLYQLVLETASDLQKARRRHS